MVGRGWGVNGKESGGPGFFPEGSRDGGVYHVKVTGKGETMNMRGPNGSNEVPIYHFVTEVDPEDGSPINAPSSTTDMETGGGGTGSQVVDPASSGAPNLELKSKIAHVTGLLVFPIAEVRGRPQKYR